MEFLKQAASHLVVPGLPEWTGMLFLLITALAGIAFAAMPFAVFGLKSKLEILELELEDIHSELRALAAQLSSTLSGPVRPEHFLEPPTPPRAEYPAPPTKILPNLRLGAARR